MVITFLSLDQATFSNPHDKDAIPEALVAVMRTLRDYGTVADELEEPSDFMELFYENEFPCLVRDPRQEPIRLRLARDFAGYTQHAVFFPHTYFGAPGVNITDEPYLDEREEAGIG